jgi:hypothetical protein
VRDVLLSEPLNERGVEIALMDIVADHLPEVEHYAHHVARQLGRDAQVVATTDLEVALDGADFVVSAIEVERFLYWAQDYHVPRKHGFRQVFGENGGPGGLFHALRNMTPTVEIARAMERLCPNAPLLNFTNPEHKLCEAVSRLTSIKAVGLCHGVFMGLHQIARMLEMRVEDLDASACGINHFTWFQNIRDRRTGEDLYPRLRKVEREGDWLSDWHEIGMARILLRRFGLWPSPAVNHYGEYIRWADEFFAGELQQLCGPGERPIGKVADESDPARDPTCGKKIFHLADGLGRHFRLGLVEVVVRLGVHHLVCKIDIRRQVLLGDWTVPKAKGEPFRALLARADPARDHLAVDLGKDQLVGFALQPALRPDPFQEIFAGRQARVA